MMSVTKELCAEMVQSLDDRYVEEGRLFARVPPTDKKELCIFTPGMCPCAP